MNRIEYIVLFLLWCVTGQELRAQPNYIVTPLELNSKHTNEIYAIPYGDGVICCSDRRTNILVNRVDSAGNQLFHLFYIPFKDTLRWSIPQLLSKNISINAHQGPCCLTPNGQELYFTMNNESGARIYSAQKSRNDWINIRPFVHNRPNYITTHPSLSRDGNRFFFASNMPGGYGGFDIYVCERTNRGWGPPQNLGPEVNTPENELYPFAQGNGVLYFSSSAHDSMGGMDIFSVCEVNGKWEFRRRLEEPINSTNDDISYTSTDADGTEGYIVSNRNGQTFDIFSFKSLFPVFPDCQEQIENEYSYTIFEPGIMGLDTIPTLKLIWEMGDGTILYGDSVEHTYASTGQYDIYLSVLDTLTGEFSTHVEHLFLEVLDEEQPYIIANETVKVGEPVSFDASKTYLPDLEIDEYYWMFGDGTRKKGMYTEHTYIVTGVYRIQLGVIGRSKYTGVQEKICVYREILVE